MSLIQVPVLCADQKKNGCQIKLGYFSEFILFVIFFSQISSQPMCSSQLLVWLNWETWDWEDSSAPKQLLLTLLVIHNSLHISIHAELLIHQCFIRHGESGVM